MGASIMTVGSHYGLFLSLSSVILTNNSCAGHVNEPWAQRIPHAEETRLAGLLSIPVAKHEILRRYCNSEPGKRMIQLEDLRRIEAKHVKPSKTRKDFHNMCLVLQRPEVKVRGARGCAYYVP